MPGKPTDAPHTCYDIQGRNTNTGILIVTGSRPLPLSNQSVAGQVIKRRTIDLGYAPSLDLFHVKAMNTKYYESWPITRGLATMDKRITLHIWSAPLPKTPVLFALHLARPQVELPKNPSAKPKICYCTPRGILSSQASMRSSFPGEECGHPLTEYADWYLVLASIENLQDCI